MNIFDEIGNEIPPFAEYGQYMYETKRTALIGENGNKVVPLKRLREDLFFSRV